MKAAVPAPRPGNQMIETSGRVGFIAKGLVALTAAFVVCACFQSASASAMPATFRLGFSDGLFTSPEPSSSLALARQAGGRIVRLEAAWNGIARTKPADQRNPADPAYSFSALDRSVITAVKEGLEPLLLANAAPAWAQEPGIEKAPFQTRTGAWKPDAAAFGDFGRALATRYSGSFTPAGSSGPLPRVRTFQAWNEPNLNLYLSPQWEPDGAKWRAFAPVRYRSMLNAFTKAVKAVRRDNMVVTAGTSPYGEDVGSWRHRPLAFWRDVLCVQRRCSNPANFDALSSHPYVSSREGPLVDSFNHDDLPVLGMKRLASLLRTAENLRRVAGPKRHRLWATELGYETNPPDPDGVSLGDQSRFLTVSLFLLWEAGVDTMIWNQLLDQAAGGDIAATIQSGLFFSSGEPKPASKSFAFPFTTDPANRRSYWGIAPKRGEVFVQRLSRGRWIAVARTVTNANRIFRGTAPIPRNSVLRAVQKGVTSPLWRAG